MHQTVKLSEPVRCCRRRRSGSFSTESRASGLPGGSRKYSTLAICARCDLVTPSTHRIEILFRSDVGKTLLRAFRCGVKCYLKKSIGLSTHVLFHNWRLSF